MGVLTDIGNWAQKTFSPQQFKQKAQPSFLDRVNQIVNTKFMPGQQMTLAQGFNKATQNFSQDFGNVLRGTGGIQGQQLKNPIIPKIPVISNAAKLSANTFQTATSGLGDIARGGRNVVSGIQQRNPLQVGQGAVNTLFGGAKVATSLMPWSPAGKVFQAGNVLSQSRGDLTQRLGKGIIQGQTGITTLAPNVKEKNINILGAKFDPIVGAGSLVGFTQNPAWAKIFGKTTKLAQYGLKGIALKGGFEGLIQGLDQLPDNPSQKDITNILLTNIAFGTGAEVGTKAVSDVFKKINGTKLAQSIKEDISNRFTSKMVDTVSGPMPFWKKELKILLGQTEDIFGTRQDATQMAQSSIELPSQPRPEQPYPWSEWNDKLKRWVDPSVPNEILYPIKRGKYIPSFTKEQIDQDAARATLVTTENINTFKELFGKWFGKRKASETTAVINTQKFEVPKGVDGGEVIRYLEDPEIKVSPETKAYTDQVKGKFDELYKEAKKAGIDVGYLKNYITHIWDRPPEEVARLYKGASQKFKFASGREFPTYEEGIQMGLTPKYTNPQQILAQYINNLEKTKANIEFVRELKGQGFLVAKRVPGFEPITAPGFVSPSIRLGDDTIREGVYYAPPEIAKAINRVFAPETSAFSGTAKISSGLQDLALSGGVPLTPLNAWTFAQTQKEVMGGRVRGPLKAIWTSLSEGGTNNYVKNNAQFIKEQQLNNVPLSTSVNIDSMTRDGIFKTLFKGKVGEAWHRMVNEPTFKRFMPVLQTEFYKDVRKSAIQSGRSEEEAIKIATQATKNFYGLNSASDTALKSQLGKDLLSTVFFAPRYRESMINFWVKNLQSIANPLALENRANVKFMASAILTYLAMDKVNQLYNGRPMSENPKGKEDKVLIPLGDGYTLGVPFLSSIATIPRTAYKITKDVIQGDIPAAGKEAKNLLSFGIRPPLDVITNENYFGGQIYEPGSKDQAKDIGKYLFGQYQHPYLREAINQFSGKQPAYQTFSKAMELPLRFYKDSAIKSGYYYDTKAEVLKGMSKEDAAILEKWIAKKPKDISQAQSTQMSMAEALEKLARPDLLRKESQLRIQTAFKTKDPLDPFYSLTPEQQQTALRLQTFYPGDKQKSEMQTANIDWLKPYWAARSAYFDELTSKGIMKPMESSTLQASPELQKKLDYYYTLPYGTGDRTAYIKQNQDLVQFWDKKAAETNAKREELGLAPISSGGFGSYQKKPKKVSFKKIKIKKPSISNIKVKKLPKLKLAKQPKIKAIKVKKIKSLLTSKGKGPTIKIKA